MRPNWNSGQVSNWGNAPKEIAPYTLQTVDSSYRSGYVYALNDIPSNTGVIGVSSLSVAAGYIRYVPIRFPQSLVMQRIGFSVGGASASWEARLAVYDDSGSNGYAGTLIEDFGTFSVTSTGVKLISLGSPRTFSANVLYWFAYRQNTTNTGTIWAYVPRVAGFSTHFGTAGATQTHVLLEAGTYGAFPTTANGAPNSGWNGPLLYIGV